MDDLPPTTTLTPPHTPPHSPPQTPTQKKSPRRNVKKHASAALDDNRFKEFVQNADEIESIEHFTYWKDEFLATFRQYLDPVGTATARECDEELYFELERLAHHTIKVKKLVTEGNITPEKCSVKGQKCINEMLTNITTCEKSINIYCPKTQVEEKICGYSKFELAAVLVRDGFRVYGLMTATRDYIQGLVKGVLSDVLKPNQHSIIQYYCRCLDSFTQIISDLGMFKLMTKCIELYKVRPRKKKKKKFNSKTTSLTDALSDTSGSDNNAPGGKGGRMFQRSKIKTKAIMDKGWSSGLDGKEVKPIPSSKSIIDNDGKKTKKKSKTKKGKKKPDDESSPSLSSDMKKTIAPVVTNGQLVGNDDAEGGRLDADGIPLTITEEAASAGHPKDEDSNEIEDDEATTASSSEEEDDEEEEEEEEEEEDDEFIYYFDPVNEIVGKVSRKKCLAENVIFTVNKSSGTEEAEGIIDEWDTKDDKIGKTEMIVKLKDILRGQAMNKMEGLDS
jgi:hypothetical protein